MSFFISLGSRHSFVKCPFFVHSQLTQIYLNFGDEARRNKIGGSSRNTYVFFHFVSQEELIASTVILLQCTKLILRVSTCLQIFEKFTKIELAGNVAKIS